MKPAPKAEIISVGDELIAGSYVDLNAPMLARALLGIGIETHHFTTVPDERSLLAQALKLAASRSSVVLVTGGLGPTEDDVTRHSAADAAGVVLRFDEPTWRMISTEMSRRGRVVSESNKLSASFPQEAKILPNDLGTAPGFRMNIASCWLYFLPGPPGEAQQMLDTHVLPDLAQNFEKASAHYHKRLHLFGITESQVGEKIQDRMLRGRNPRVGTTVRKGVITIGVLAREKSFESAKKLAEKEASEIRAMFSAFVFGEDGLSLQVALGQALIAEKITIATAESCTGGLIGKLLTDVPGISAVYRGGFITYSNKMKQSVLGIPAELLEKHGAVSEPVARAMAESACRVARAELGIGITGIAGPSGGTPEKPEGLVYLAISYRGKTTVERRLFPPGDRKRIRELAAREALFRAWMSVL